MIKTAEQKKDINDGVYNRDNKNYAILCEADGIGWRLAKKTKGMIARVLEKDTQFISEETKKRQIGQLGKMGTMFCVGLIKGEYWTQAIADVEKKYINKGRYPQPFTVDYMKNEENVKTYDDFFIYEPKPEAERLVCQIKHDFKVISPWAPLDGKPGDFLIKQKEDALNPDPQDVWLVDQSIFNRTYEFK